MKEQFQVGELVQYYAKKYDATVVGEIIELPNKHKGVKIRIVDSPYSNLLGQEWFIGENRLLKAGGRPRAFVGGQAGYGDPLVEIRDRVLNNLPPELAPVVCTKDPQKDVWFKYNPEWISYHIWVSERGLELKLTLQIKDEHKRDAAYRLLRAREPEIRDALGGVEFNWRASPPRTVFEEIRWPGEQGPRWQDIDRIVERLTLYIKTLQPILSKL